ncbi:MULTISPECIES: hypothetical protein [Streptomyces]|uniref:hypothetical protein n=1 Tax=Streptomyces TaxID=1883 RepID=UPI001E3AFD6A|nr:MULTISPECIES: hypothetical protein [Streptomyces]UFQ19665.1 hypothetical protein J2N69_34470 [Streptomyces huasconensis]WCL89284.1 hypothetical protein PPN52_34415 [Streptomyces sp. JCM 35825]
MSGRPRGRLRRLREAVGPLAAAVLVCGALTVPASAASTAEPACWLRPGEPHRDWTGMNFAGDMWCDLTPGSVRIQSRSTSPVVGKMLFSPRWFVCWKEGSDYMGNNIWYYTQGDQVVSSPTVKAWGYMPAVAVKAPQHPFPGLTQCPWS